MYRTTRTLSSSGVDSETRRKSTQGCSDTTYESIAPKGKMIVLFFGIRIECILDTTKHLASNWRVCACGQSVLEGWQIGALRLRSVYLRLCREYDSRRSNPGANLGFACPAKSPVSSSGSRESMEASFGMLPALILRYRRPRKCPRICFQKTIEVGGPRT